MRQLHEALCFLRAYPDDAAVLARVEEMLAGFDQRPDLRRHRKALANSGIAGTAIHIPFFAQAAIWVTQRWGDRLSIDWKEFPETDRLEDYLERFALFCETPGFDELPLSAREWIAHMKGPSETDAAFLVRRFRALRLDPRLHEMLYDALDPPFILSPGPDTPARTRLKFRQATVQWQTGPLQHERPSLVEEVERPPLSVRAATRAEARQLIHLARSMMVSMDRDLDAFSYASEEDVQIADCGRNLVFSFIGLAPDRRLMFEAVYGFLALKNGVPLGYGTVATLFGSVGAGLQRLGDVPRWRGRARLRAARCMHAPSVWLRYVQPVALPDRRRQPGSGQVGRLVVLPEARLPGARCGRAAPHAARA